VIIVNEAPENKRATNSAMPAFQFKKVWKHQARQLLGQTCQTMDRLIDNLYGCSMQTCDRVLNER
jgi:hypothetical protein